MTTRLAVFDCDGTLVDGQAGVCDAMEAAFAAAALPAPHRTAVRRIVGLSLPQAIATLAPEAAPDQRLIAVDAYKTAFRAARDSGRLAEPLFAGIAPLIDRLRAAGWLLGVATGKSQRGLVSCLATHGLTAHFATLQTADHHPSKPHPSMLETALAETGALAAHAVMIGDTAYDMEMARTAQVRAIGVAWGYHTVEELQAAGAECVATTPDELGDILL